ncbi:MAG: hypothetical protein GVX78_01555 [Bacteroidetes bacterium]|jgi:hypothetical protein|nr:hypothetical protein [Bacteroidota bacterium]
MKYHFLERNSIHKEKWDDAIKKTAHPVPYALSWYLDVSTKRKWDGIIKGDYESVMPLPYKKRAGFKQVYQPPLSQQLGVFGQSVSEEDITHFFRAIPNSIAPISIPMNAQLKRTSVSGWLSQKKNNYVLPLNKPYKKLREGYSHGLKSNINKNKSKVSIQSFHNVEELDQHFNKLIGSRIGISKNHREIAAAVLKKAYEKNYAFMIQVLAPDNEWASQLYFLKTKTRIVKIRAVANDKGRKYCANHLGIDHVIQTYANQNTILDFEGSSIPGVANFFKSFGADLEPYYLYEKKGLSRNFYGMWKKLQSQFF